MIPSREFVEQAAARTGFQQSSLEKVIMLGDLAGDISRHPLSEYSLERIKDRLLLQSIETRLLPMLNSEDIDLADKSIQKAFEIISSLLMLSDDELKYVDAVSEGELHLLVSFF